jgi:hypothetical protein
MCGDFTNFLTCIHIPDNGSRVLARLLQGLELPGLPLASFLEQDIHCRWIDILVPTSTIGLDLNQGLI